MATEDAEDLSLRCLQTLPLEVLRPSAVVDFVLFFACGKPAIRLAVDTAAIVETLGAWCREFRYDFTSDGNGFACVARDMGEAARALEIDLRAEPHEVELGLALGYPRCCCLHVASVGESGIDGYAEEVSGWHFVDDFRLINPSGYHVGQALISHLPCSPACEASLPLAKMAREFVLSHSGNPALFRLYNSPLLSA